jgi:hypothetical protein
MALLNASRGPWAIWAILNVAGIVLIALPDAGNRVFSISPGHGPAPFDLAGAVLLTAGWVILDLWTWRRRSSLRSLNGGRSMGILLLLAAAGAVLIVWSVSQDEGTWWLLGAGVLAAVQVAAAVAAAFAPGD